MLVRLCDSEPLPVTARSRLYTVWSINIKPRLDLRDPHRSCPDSVWLASCRTAYHLFLCKTAYITSNMRELFYIYVGWWCPLVSVLFYLMSIWAAPCPVFITRHLLILSHWWMFPHSNISILHYFISWVTDFIRIHVSNVFISPELFTLLHLSAFMYNVHINKSFIQTKQMNHVD